MTRAAEPAESDAEERARLAEELAKFPEMNPGPVLRFDPEGTILLANKAARELFATTDLVGASWFDVCPDMDTETWRDVIDPSEDISLEIEIADRCIRFVHVGDESGELFFAFGTDVTPIRESNRILAEKTRQLAEIARLPDMNPGPVIQMDDDTRILLANRAALELFGDSLEGASWSEVCPGFEESFWNEVLASDRFMTLERRIDRQNFIFYHRCDAATGRVFVYGADVTEQRRADELIRLLLTSTGEGIYGVDQAGCCTFANPSTVRMLGYESDRDLLGHQMHEVAHHSDIDGSPRSMDGCRICGVLGNREGAHIDDDVLWRRDGTSIPVECWSHPLEVEGELTGAVVTFVDITERRLIADELMRARIAAEEASAAKSQFMASMSHELRTPMNAIIGYSEMLIEDAEESGDTATAADLRKINAAGSHLLELINTVLDLSKIEAGQMELHLEPVEVETLLDDVSTLAKPLIDKNQSRFTREIDAELGILVCDVTKVRQSLLNLLSNAAKFCPDGQVTLAARRETGGEHDWVVVEVTDTGIGIPEDKLDHVFEEFAQASSTTARDYGGTGLGLSVTRRLCRLHGGDVTLTSEVGSGSTFTIKLPADGREAVELAAGPISNESETPPDVLVIDDDPHARDLIARTLEREGFRVVTAPGGERGLHLARSLGPALITLDIIMPSMDGWSTLAALKADARTADIPVALVSIAPDHELAITMGAVESLTKPFDREALYRIALRYVVGDGFHVLVVDDDESSRKLLRRYVEAAGWSCDEADTGLSALERVHSRVPDLILLDLMMPVMDGFEFVDELRSTEEYRAVPIVVVSAKTLTDHDRARLNGNVEQVIDKSRRSASEVLDYIRGLLTPGAAGD
jgi:PAS domain S-box-containing protein